MPRPRNPGPTIRSSPTGCLVALLLSLALPFSAVSAQQSRESSEGAAVRSSVRPSGDRLTTGAWTYRMRSGAEGMERDLGTYRVSVRRAFGPSGSTWRIVQRTDLTGAPSAIVDSAWLEPESLRPLRQSSSSPRGDLELRFRDGSVRGERTAPDGTVEEISEELAPGTYAASVEAVLMQALPLRQGSRIELPLYSDTRGAVPWEVEVTGSETVVLESGTSLDTWVVSVRVGSLEAIRWVHKWTGVEVRTEARLSGGDRFVQELVRFSSSGGR